MARIAGVNLPNQKRLEIGLTYIYGIGQPTAQEICDKLGLSRDTKVRDLTEDEVAKLRDLLLRLRQELGLGILVVEHNMPFVSGLCDRLVVLDLGQLIANGPPVDVLRDPKVMASYLGEDA